MTGVMNFFFKLTQQFYRTHVTSFTDLYSVCVYFLSDDVGYITMLFYLKKNTTLLYMDKEILVHMCLFYHINLVFDLVNSLEYMQYNQQ
jgi:hypothetical protein